MYIKTYYISIISLLYRLFSINSDYIKVLLLLHPNFQELVDADSSPMHRGVTDNSPGAAAKLWDDKASSLCEAKSTYSGEKRLLYALFLVLYLLF